MAQVQRFFLYDEGEPTISDLVTLLPDQVRAMSDHVDRYGFAGTPDQLLALAARLNISYEKTADLIQYAGYLQSERLRLGLDVSGLLEEFDTFLVRHKLEGELKQQLTALYEPLRKLFADRPKVALREKVASVTAGVVPQGIDFRSICDLRPIFDERRETILEYSVVALVRVLLRSEVLPDSTVVFQVDAQGVKQLEELVTRIKTKMTALEVARTRLIGGKNE